MKKESNLMTSGSIAKVMIQFTIPIILGNLFQQLYNAIDAIIVGNYIGSNALAAVSSSGNLINLLIGLFQGVALGGGVIIASYFGKKDYEKLETSVHTTVTAGFFLSLALTIIGVLCAPIILVWMGTPADVLPESIGYFRVYFSGSIGFVMYNVFVGVLRAVGDSKRPLQYLMISAGLNLVLDVFFIAILGLGVEFAALATVISQLVSAGLCFLRLLKTEDVYRLQIKKLRVDGPMLLKILRIGIPSGIQQSIISLANVVVQSNVNSFGALAMAGLGSYAKLEGFVFLPIMSVGMTVTTFISQNLGAGETERAKKGAVYGVISTVIMAQLVGLVLYFFGEHFMVIFDSNPEVIAFGMGRAEVASLFYMLLAFSHSMAAVYRGTGNTFMPMLVMVICWCVIRVTILNVVMAFEHDIWIVYWVYPITWSLSSLVYALNIKRINWNKLSGEK